MVRANARGFKCDGPILGIDLAPVNTGLCLLTPSGAPWRFHTIRRPMPPKRKRAQHAAADEAFRLERALNIANEIVGIAKTFKVSFVAIEGYSFSKNWQAHNIGEVAGVVKSQIAMSCGVIPVPIGARSARARVFGKVPGKTKKREIQDAVVGLLSGSPVKPANDHEADAYVVAFALFRMMQLGDIEPDAMCMKSVLEWRLAELGGEPPFVVDAVGRDASAETA